MEKAAPLFFIPSKTGFESRHPANRSNNNNKKLGVIFAFSAQLTHVPVSLCHIRQVYNLIYWKHQNEFVLKKKQYVLANIQFIPLVR